MVFYHYGQRISREKIRYDAGLGRQGVTLLSIADTAEKYGFKTLGTKVNFKQLVEEVDTPCILHWNEYHFVVLISITKKYAIIADPAEGRMKLKKNDFIKGWLNSGSENDLGIVLLIKPGARFYKSNEENKSQAIGFRIFKKYLEKYNKEIIQIFFGLLLASGLQLIIPYLTQSVVDIGIRTKDLNFIKIVLFAQFTLFFSLILIEFVRSRTILFLSTQMNLSILSDFWVKLLRLPIQFFESRTAGDILQRINDHKRIERFITSTALQTIFSIFNFIIFSFVLLSYNFNIFLIFSIGSVIYIVWIKLFLKYRRSIDKDYFHKSSKENNTTLEIISGVSEIKLNNAEKKFRWKWENDQSNLFKLGFKSLSLSQFQKSGAFFVNQGKNFFTTYYVAYLVINGELTLGAMVAIQYIIGVLNGPVEQLINFLEIGQDAKLSMDRLNEIHEMEEEENELHILKNVPEKGDITLENISFKYPGVSNDFVLRDLSFTIPFGKITALVGSSGSGKTTVLKILQKYYYDFDGSIKVGSDNFRFISPSMWRRVSSRVMQESFIFNDTFMANISLGQEIPDWERVKEACSTANILSTIESTPHGFNSKVGTNGGNLSTGQKQRLLLARAIYRNPSYFFLDEATNALDSENEAEIMNNLVEFLKERTTLIVSHRLSTIIHADNIIVLDNGQVVEIGNHQNLIKSKGHYYRLFQNQFHILPTSQVSI